MSRGGRGSQIVLVMLASLVFCAATAIAASAQTLTTLASFNFTNGANPRAGLVQATDGNFYGTTGNGGAHGAGTVFRMTPSGTLTTLHDFNGTDGEFPYAGLVQATDGNFYGTTIQGGASYAPPINGCGTVFRITSAGALTTLHSFTCTDGAQPFAGLVQATDGNFYGTTTSGGAHSYGTVFKITSAGALTTLHSFAGTDGGFPYARLVQATDGNFYGTAEGGGSGTCPPFGCGTAFKITSGGDLTTLHNFNGTDGEFPYAGLVQATDGNFYATTEGGGAHSYGTVFRMTLGGTLTTLYSFSGPDGGAPYAGLVQANDGNFYGTTEVGGGNILTCGSVCGTVFKITPGGTLTTLQSFSGPDGGDLFAGLVQANDGNLYGATHLGGTSGYGTVFRLAAGLGVTLSVTKTGSGTVISGDGAINCGSVCSAGYFSGSVVTLTATPAPGWAFTNWNGCDTIVGNTCTVKMALARNVTATFTGLYLLSVSAVGSGTITSADGGINCGTACSHSYLSGSSVVLTATPAVGWVFASWSGCDTVTAGNACNVTMSSARSVSATFIPTLTVSPTGSGTVTSSDGTINCPTVCSANYATGTTVTLTATPAGGWAFTGWGGCDIAQGSVCTVHMISGRNVTATFKLTYMLSVTTSGSGTVTTSDLYINCGSNCSHLYPSGSQVLLTATPAVGSTFSNWSGCSSLNNVCVVTMNSAQSVTASFSPVHVGLTSLQFNPTLVRGWQITIGTLTLATPAPPGGVTVGLSSSQPQTVYVPASIYIRPGQTTANFAARVISPRRTVVTITAVAGSASTSGVIAILP